MATLPDVNVRVHEGGGHDEFPRRRKGDMVPAEPVDDILELVLGLELDAARVKAHTQLGEVRHEDRADDSVGAVDEQVAPVTRQTNQNDDAIAEPRRVDRPAGLRLNDVDPSLRCSCDDVVA